MSFQGRTPRAQAPPSMNLEWVLSHWGVIQMGAITHTCMSFSGPKNHDPGMSGATKSSLGRVAKAGMMLKIL